MFRANSSPSFKIAIVYRKPNAATLLAISLHRIRFLMTPQKFSSKLATAMML